MVRTRAKKKAGSLNTVNKKAAENVLTGKQTSDSVTMKEEEPKLGSESEGKKEITADKDGNDENEETNADHGDENTVVREMYDEPEQNTSEDDVETDDQEDEMWDDEDSEENVKNSVDKDKVNNDEAIEEQDDDFDGTSEEEAMGEEDSEEVEYSEESMDDGDEEHSENDKELTEAADKDTEEQNVQKATSSKKIEKSNENSGRLKKVEKSSEGTERKLEKSSEGTKRKLEKSSEDTEKKLEKSSEKSGKKVRVQMLKKVGTRDRPESSSKGKTRKRVASMGMIFMCSSKTKDDCYKYKVLGLPESKKDLVEKIYVGMRLFLYDVDQKLMYGIYKAAGPGGFNIEPNAFKSQFPAQVRFTVLDDCLPLSEEKFKKVIKDNYFTNTKFDGQLNSEQVKKMCKLFVSTSKGKQLKKFGRLGKSGKSLPVRRESTKRPRVGDKRRLAPKEDPRYHERSRKRRRKVISSAAPSRRSPLAPLSPTLPLYASRRSADVGAYRRNPHLESRSRYKEKQDQVISRREPCRDWRDAPPEHDRYRDGHNINLVSRYPDRDEGNLNLVSRYPIRDERDSYILRSEPYLEHRLPNTDGRDPYRERRDSYRDERDPYLRIRDSYRDGRDSYLDRRGSYTDRTYSTTYDNEKRDLLSDRDRIYREVQEVDYRETYRRELPERDNLLPLSLESRRRHEIGSSRNSYATSAAYQRLSSYADPAYSSEYASRLGLAREYHL